MKYTIVWSAVIYSLSALSLPSLINRCGEYGVNIRLPSDSDIVVFNKECDTAFIGPPSAGSAEITALAGSSNLGFCGSVKSLPKTLLKLHQALDQWMSKLTQASHEALGLEKDLDNKRSTLIAHEEKVAILEEDLEKAEENSVVILEKATDAKERLERCRKFKEEAQCTSIADELKNLEIEYDNDELLKIKPLKIKISDAKKDVRIIKHEIRQVSINITENEEIFELYKKRIHSLRNEAIEEYGVFGRLEGVTAQILFESNWIEQINKTKNMNPFSTLHIASLPITKSIIHVDSKLPSAQQLNVPSSLLYASIPGFAPSGSNGTALPTGNTEITNLEASASPVNSYLSGVSGRLSLSLIGSCELTDDQNRLKENQKFNELTSYISINTINEYPLLHERSHKVHFVATRFAEEIEKRTEKGGFFHTSSVQEILKLNFSDDDFQVDFEVDSLDDLYTEEEKALLTNEAKKEIVDRVLKEIGTVAELKSPPPLPISRLKQSGGAKIYAEAPCMGWTYCYATKFVIGVLDSVFGKQETVQKFKALNISRVTHVYNSRKPATYSFVTTFKPKN